MALYGAREITYDNFGGGLVLDVDATEIGADQASDCANVDFDDETVSKRKGRAVYTFTSPVAAPVLGVHAYYPRDGGARQLIFVAGSSIYEDHGPAGWTAVQGGLAAGRPMDFVGWKEVVYAGNGADALRRRSAAGFWSAVAGLTAPASAPTLATVQTVLESFDGGAWALAGSGIATSYVTEPAPRQGSNALKLTLTGGAVGSSVSKAFSAGATVDLSKATHLVVWFYAERVGMTFQVGVKENGGTLDFSRFPTYTTSQKDTWVPIEVPLSGIAPAARSASPGLGIRFVSKTARVTYPAALYFDSAMPRGALVPDRYVYRYTYAEADSAGTVLRETNPSPAGELDLQANPPALGTSLTVTGTAESGVNQIRVYRHRANGPFRRARLVAKLTNPGTSTISTTDYQSDGELVLDDAPELVSGKANPPLAQCYAAVNNRLLAGNVSLSGTQHPWRLYLSQLGFPEAFGSTEQPEDPNVPGWVDLPTKDHIRRIVEFDGQAVLFCDRSIWALEGSGWDDFALRKRADVGLDARSAVAITDRFIYFLASDGVRVLSPNRTFEGLFETWVVSEPVDSRLRAIPPAYRKECAMGVDERGRVHLSLVRPGQTAPDAALVFDPRRPGALAPGYTPLRRGWTYYTNWGFRAFVTLKRGGGDAGQLVGGDASTGRLHFLQRSSADADLENDDPDSLGAGGAAISWHWQGRAVDAGPGGKWEWVYVATDQEVRAGQSITATPVLDRAVSAIAYALSAAAATAEKRTAAGIRARFAQLRLGGAHGVAMKVRSARIGMYRRQ